MFEHTRAVPEGWQEELERRWPRSDQVPWLKLVWMPGETYQPVQRWVLYEMVPDLDLIVDPTDPNHKRMNDFMGEFERPHPRDQDQGWWVEDPEVEGGKRWHSKSLVSALQYELFHETNCFPSLCWVIQGENGGHPWALANHDRTLYAIANGVDPQDIYWPSPGDLPYAPFDQRVVQKMQHYDRLLQDQKAAANWQARYRDKHGDVDPKLARMVLNSQQFKKQTEINLATEKFLDETFKEFEEALTPQMVDQIMSGAPETGFDDRVNIEEVRESWQQQGIDE